jgi:hypothetical protein
VEERGLVTDRMILPRFRAIWRRWRRGAALFGPYQAKLEHTQALRQQRRLAMERERREASMAVAALLNSRAASSRARFAPRLQPSVGSTARPGDLEVGLPGPGNGYTRSDSRGGALRPNADMRTRAGIHGVQSDEAHQEVRQTRSGTAVGLAKRSNQDRAGSNVQRMRAELCWPVAPPPLPPPPQEPCFTPSNLAPDGGHSHRLPNRGDSRGPNHHRRGRGHLESAGLQQRRGKERPVAGPAQSPKSSSGGEAIQSFPRRPDRANAAVSTGRQRTSDAGIARHLHVDAVQVSGPVKVGEGSDTIMRAQDGVSKTSGPSATTCKESDRQARGEHIPLGKVQEGQRKQRRDGRGGNTPARAGEHEHRAVNGKGGGAGENADASSWGFPASGGALEAADSQANRSYAPASSGPAYMPPARPVHSRGEPRPPAPGIGCRLPAEQSSSSPAASDRPSVPAVWTVPQEMDLPFFF